MCPQYQYDPSKHSASFETFPKDQYEVQVGEPKAFLRQNQKGEDSYGIRFPLTLKGGQFDGKRTMYSAYLNGEGGGFAKQFMMAALGYKLDQNSERQFDADFTGQDWSYDTETGAVGDMWRKATGQRMVVDLDVEPAKDNQGALTGEFRQRFAKFHPISILTETANV